MSRPTLCVAAPCALHRRRGVVAIKVALFSVVLIGFAALGVDVGVIYNARLELQRCVDASAMAGAAELARTTGDSGLEYARDIAVACALDNIVAGEGLVVDDDDVEFGWAEIDAETNEFFFDPNSSEINAVHVTGHRTEDNEQNGPVQLYFARVFGIDSTEMSRSATALMRPRDIAIVADLSTSHNNDSELRNMHVIEINLGDVWAALPGGIDDDPAAWGPGWAADDPLAQGFAWSFFQRALTDTLQHGGGFGYDPTSETVATTHIEPLAYDPNEDTGLIGLPLGFNAEGDPMQAHWAPGSGNEYEAVADYLVDNGYSTQPNLADFVPADDPALSSELYAIMGDHLLAPSEETARWFSWVFRTAVATGYADWYSGLPGGKWESGELDAPFFPPYVDDRIDAHEVLWGKATMGNRMPMQMAMLWVGYTLQYISMDPTLSSAPAMLQEGSPDFRWKFGPKTFTNFLMEARPSHADTPELAGTPHQPTHSVKLAVAYLANSLSPDYHDRMSLEIFGTTVQHEVDLTEQVVEVPDRLGGMQAHHYDGDTNIGGGLREGRLSLTGPDARPNASKVLVLLSDGVATAWESLSPSSPDGVVTANHSTQGNEGNEAVARAYVVQQAEWARDAGIQVFAVNIGAVADADLMIEIAEITNGRFFQVIGNTIAERQQRLLEVFEQIAISRPVTLVQ